MRSPEAQFLEFGVHEGKDIARIASFLTSIQMQSNRKNVNSSMISVVHGFDSFEGLPEDWKEKFPAGAFDVDGQAPAVEHLHQQIQLKRNNNFPLKNVVFHKGWFHETLPAFLDNHYAPVAFLHLDADLYSSTKTVLHEICRRKLLKRGTVILFDEFWNYEGNWEDGECRAWNEIVDEYQLQYKYLAYHGPTGKHSCHYGYQSVCIVIEQDML